MENKDSCCLGKLLKVIDILQKNANGNDCFDESCTRPYLGSSPNIICCKDIYLSDSLNSS